MSLLLYRCLECERVIQDKDVVYHQVTGKKGPYFCLNCDRCIDEAVESFVKETLD